MRVLRALARLLLLVSVSGVMPQPFAHVQGADVVGVRTVPSPAAATLTRALRHADAVVLSRESLRLDTTGRSHQLAFAVSDTRLGVEPPALNGPLLSHAVSAQTLNVRSSASLRGPPRTV